MPMSSLHIKTERLSCIVHLTIALLNHLLDVGNYLRPTSNLYQKEVLGFFSTAFVCNPVSML